MFYFYVFIRVIIEDENEFESQDKLDEEHSIFSENLICETEDIPNQTGTFIRILG